MAGQRVGDGLHRLGVAPVALPVLQQRLRALDHVALGPGVGRSGLLPAGDRLVREVGEGGDHLLADLACPPVQLLGVGFAVMRLGLAGD